MKITLEMVTEFNNELALKGCPFRYEYDEYGTKRKFANKDYASKYEQC